MQQKKTVVITGGNSGIGLAVAKLYLSQGNNLAIISRSIGELGELLNIHPESLLFFEGNVGDIKTLERFYQKCVEKFNSIDILVVNAGIAKAIHVDAITEEDYSEIMNTNVKAAFFTIQKSLGHLNGNATITLISSIQAEKGSGLWALYGASKAAVRSLTRSFAQELGERNIRVNCVSPGVTKTPIFQKFGIDCTTLESMLDGVIESTPLRRLGEPNEIAHAIEFINSPKASFITGVDLQVDGGLIQV